MHPSACTLRNLTAGLVITSGVLAQDGSVTTPADLIVTNGYVVTMNDGREIHEHGALVIQGSRLLAVGPAAITAKYTAPRTIDARGAIVMPGMINTHTHAAMTVFRGLGDDVPDRLRQLIFPLEKTLVDRTLVYWGGLHGMIEMVEGGVTTFVDMYYFEDEVARAACSTAGSSRRTASSSATPTSRCSRRAMPASRTTWSPTSNPPRGSHPRSRCSTRACASASAPTVR